MCEYMHILLHAYTFHVCTSMRRVLLCMYFHETCTLCNMSKHGPHKHVTGMHCSIVMVPCKITDGKMKLQLSGTVYDATHPSLSLYMVS